MPRRLPCSFLVTLVIDCNTVSPGECWPNTSGGFGGGGPIPIGAGVGATTGDYPAAPSPGPLANGNDANPCIISQGPCNDKCEADYEVAAIKCAKIAIEAQRKACNDGAYSAYKQCQAACENDPVERCKKRCDEENEKCIASCPKGDKGCMAKCNDVYSKCLKGCK